MDLGIFVTRYTIKHSNNHHAPVVQTLDSAIHWINHYLLDNSIGFASVYPLLDSDLSGGQRYPLFEQLGPYLHPQQQICVYLSMVKLLSSYHGEIQVL